MLDVILYSKCMQFTIICEICRVADKKWNIPYILYIDPTIGQFRKLAALVTAVKCGHVNTVFKRLTTPPFTAAIKANRF